MKLIKNSDVPYRDFGDGLTLKVLISKQEGANNLDLGAVEIPPHSRTTMHTRDVEEVIYMAEGSGSVVLETGEEYFLEKGDCMLISPFVTHCHVNNADEPLKQLFIFAPQAGEETQKVIRELKIIEK